MAFDQGISHNSFGDFTHLHQGHVYINQEPNNLHNLYLRDLSATIPKLDKKRILNAKGPLLRESYQWLLNNQDFKTWLDAHSGILWIKGDPGKGKTMLVCGIIEELEDENVEKDSAYFFCQATDARINTATAVLGGLIFSLVDRRGWLLSYVRNKHLSPGRPLYEGSNSWETLCDIFEDLIQDPALSPIILIVDAIDECGTDLDQFLRLVVKTSSRVKWLLSSRNREDIERRLLSDESVNPLSLELKANAEEVSQAVKRYIDYCIPRIKANGTFLWVALVINQLQNALEWEVLELLDGIPEGLESLYKRMMSQIERQTDERRNLCLKLLSIITTAYRPLHLAELSAIWQTEPENPRGDGYLHTIAKLCGSFLTLKEGVLYFIHQSAKDFIIKKGPHAGVVSRHHFMFKASLGVMSKTLCRDICSLKSLAIHIQDIDESLWSPLVSIRYQCTYWIDHLTCASEHEIFSDLQDNCTVFLFLTEKYLYWLEALSLLRSIDQGIIMLHKLQTLAATTQSLQLVEVIKDATRFIQSNRALLQILPLQTYSSALAFAPTQSITRRTFLNRIPDDIPTVLNIPQTWGSCLQTLNGHEDEVTSVAFSPHSQLLVSGSEDQTIRIWETRTGSCLHILHHVELDEFHKGICVTFSPDSKLVASGGDRTVRIWNPDTGEEVHGFFGIGKPTKSVAFSPNSKLLASAYADWTVWIWCIETGDYLHILHHDDYDDKTRNYMSAVAFSPDMRLVASAGGVALRIWSLDIGEEVRGIRQDKQEHVISVVFSPNSGLLASGHWDQYSEKHTCVHVWCIETGTKLASIRNNLNHHWLRHWQFGTTLEGFIDAIYTPDMQDFFAVDFSADKALFAGSSILSTAIKIWQPYSDQDSLGTQHRRTDALNEDSTGENPVRMVVISPNLSMVASSSEDSGLRIWRTDTGECFQTFYHYYRNITTFIFSSDSSTVVSGDSDGTVRFWRIDTGECIGILHMTTFKSPAFSRKTSNSVQKIAVSADISIVALIMWNTVFILQKKDAETYKCLAMYKMARNRIDIQRMILSANSLFLHWRLALDPMQYWRLDIGDSVELHVGNEYRFAPRSVGECQMASSFDINNNFVWISRYGVDFLWIPSEYRPETPHGWDSLGSTVAIGTKFGKVLIFDFSIHRKNLSYNSNMAKPTRIEKKRLFNCIS
ncbi:Vegetative incompatibility protein HET-E-1 [Cladobotryum mycophilum]|uniref:Mitochondrial division protein 1 n=1 Tax=Cladobotryum mycophilum TaxID=491253 RepID=A0ABR0SZJ3_9HYPO